MSAPPRFQRAPRLFPLMPKGEMEIPPPPPEPSQPSVSLGTVLLPALFSVGALVAAIFTAAAGNLLLTLVSFGFMGVTSLTSLTSYWSQRSSYRRQVRARELQYRALLEARRQELTRQREQQRAALLQTHPDPAECLGRIERQDSRLWERAPDHDDCLLLRLGLGAQPFAVSVKPPTQEMAVVPDRLIEAAQTLAAEFGQVTDVPVCLPLAAVGVAGLAGPRASIVQLARALAIQIATHHAPDEVKIVALYPAAEAREWRWLRWLPHVWSDDQRFRWLAEERDGAHHLLMQLGDVLHRRLQLSQPMAGRALPPLPRFVVFLADSGLVQGEPVLRLLLHPDPALGAATILLADRMAALPQGCQAIAELGPGAARLVQTGATTVSTPMTPDLVDLATAERVARAIAPIRLQRLAALADIPTTVPLLDLLGVERIEDLGGLRRWQQSRPFQSLAAPIGRMAGAKDLWLDIHERGQGPHGLMAGATGSGKSELLQVMIATLAANFHPHEVAFVLIDYKGGGMANAFLELPHLVGTLTNLEGSKLEGNLALRALAALNSELQRREALFAQAGARDIDDYQQRYRRGQVREPLPHLVIIVDEFAELKARQPDFMSELVSAVRVGRSLGLHLILATQKPVGVVDEQIWANSRFRLCLRVVRPEDSQEVLRRPDAASLTGVGRAYLQVGHNDVFELFQVAWGGAPYTPGIATQDPEEIVEVALDGGRRRLRAASTVATSQGPDSQLTALIAYLRDVAASNGIQRLPGPWLAPLPEQVALEAVRGGEGWDGQGWQPARAWLEPAVGLADDPAHQTQGALRLPLGKDGHLAIYGAPGSGKTTFIQTLVTSLALTYSPADVHLYLLDFGGRFLTMFEPMPHVGAVIQADEAERLNRLLRLLLRDLNDRKEKLGRAGVNTLLAYRQATGQALPAIVVVLDNYAGLAETYPEAEESLALIAREGGNLGIHLVLTAASPLAIKSRISGNITLAVALQLAERSDYSTAVGRARIEPAPVPGRGLVKGNPPLEFQTALVASGASEAIRTAAVKGLIDQMGRAWTGPRPKPIQELPAVVPLCDLLQLEAGWRWAPTTDGLRVPLALDADELTPVEVNLAEGPHFLIAGSARSGKTVLLLSWLLALAERRPPQWLQLYLVDFHWAGLLPLRGLPQVRAYIEESDRLSEELNHIGDTLRERRQALDEARRAAGGMLDERTWLAQLPAIVLAIDDVDAFSGEASSEAKDRLEQLVRRERGLGFHIILGGQASDLGNSYDGFVRALRQQQAGFLLGTTDHGDLQLFNLRLPPGESGKVLPPGVGYYCHRGRLQKIKVATPYAGSVSLPGWVGRLAARVTR